MQQERTIRQPARDVPVLGEVDVVVCGGGPAGVGAALSCAREGARTILLERCGSLGGMWTTGLVNPLFDHANKGGILRELIAELKSRDAWRDDPVRPGFLTTFDLEQMKVLLDERMVEAGVDVLFHAWAADAVMEGREIKGVLVESKSGRAAALGRVVVDCTGDGDIAARAGAAWDKGRADDGRVQPVTLMFRLAGCQFLQQNSEHLYSLMTTAASDIGVQLPPFRRPWIIPLPGTGDAVVQAVHVYGVDATDARQLSAAYVAARKEAQLLVRIFRHIPALRDVRLVTTAEQMGVRETRRVVGRYEVTLEDVVEGRRHPDGVCLVTFGIDIHPIRSQDADHARMPAVKPYHIPYRALVPRDIDGLLLAGRCVSGTHEAHASYRVTGDCVAMGEAAGLAAAWCARDSIAPRGVDGTRLRQELRSRGTVLD